MIEKPSLKLATENGKNLHSHTEINLDSAPESLEDALDAVYKLNSHKNPEVAVVESLKLVGNEVVASPAKNTSINNNEKLIQVETKGYNRSENIDIEDFETLEEVEKSFYAAKLVFEELSKRSDNLTEITMGERMIHLFEDSKEQDKNLAKKNKEKYLKHLHLCIDRIRGEITDYSDSGEGSEEPKESKVVEKLEDQNSLPVSTADAVQKK